MAVLALHSAAMAQTATTTAAFPGPRCTEDDGSVLQAAPLLARTIAFQGDGPARPRQLALPVDTAARLSGNSVHLKLSQDRAAPVAWGTMRLIAAARTTEHVPLPDGSRGFAEVPIFARLIGYTDAEARVELDLPVRQGSPLVEHWHVVVAVCDTGKQTLVGFGTTEVRVHARSWSFLIALAFPLVTYLGLALVAMRVHHRRLDRVEESRFGTTPPPLWRLRQALNPLFITQETAGVASLSRLQLLVFTLAVVFVFVYVLARTGELAALSPDVLALLGITVLGSGLSRAVGESGSVTAANRSWLKARGLLRSNDARMPTIADLVCADGELEIARVQAIVFSSIIVAALLLQGPRDLGGFTIAEETLYLLGLSQAAYVAGKALPAESVRRLNAEIATLRAAERALAEARAARRSADVLPAGAPPEEIAVRSAARLGAQEALARTEAAWTGALAAAEDTLSDVFGETLDTEALHGLRRA